MWSPGSNHAAIRRDRSTHAIPIHDNPMGWQGYGILCVGRDASVIERNRFDYNGQSVANGASGAVQTGRVEIIGRD